MLEKIRLEEFDEIYNMIVESFPTHEIRDYQKQKDMLNNDKFNIYIMKDNGNIKGFISIWDIDDYGFIDHFAVSSKFRNEGLGGKILKEVKDIINSEIFLEVDKPCDDINKRRIGFYERNGYFLNPFEYILPPQSEGLEPMELLIMSSGGLLTLEKFNSLIKTLIEVAYK